MHGRFTRLATLIAGLGITAMLTAGGGRPISSTPGAGLTIKVGWAGPLSGELAYFGKPYLSGALLAARHFQFTGKLAGATVQVVALDDAGDPARAPLVARKLVAAGVIGVVGHYNSGSTLAAEPIYHRAHIPEVTVSSNPAVVRPGYRNLIRLGESDTVQGGDMALFVHGVLHIRSVAVFDDSQAFGHGVATTFARGARGLGITVSGPVSLDAKGTNYVPQLTAALQQHPEAIYFGGTATPGSTLCRQARAAGFTGPFLGPDGLYDPSFISRCGPAIGAAYVSTEDPQYTSSPRLRAFAARYRAAFGSAPGAFSGFGHDGMGYLLTAIDAAQRPTTAATIAKLHSITYHGVLADEHVSAAGELENPPSFIYRVAGKGFQLAWAKK